MRCALTLTFSRLSSQVHNYDLLTGRRMCRTRDEAHLDVQVQAHPPLVEQHEGRIPEGSVCALVTGDENITHRLTSGWKLTGNFFTALCNEYSTPGGGMLSGVGLKLLNCSTAHR